MKNYLKPSLFFLSVTMILSMFTSCQTESIGEEEFASENLQSSKTGVSEKLVALYSIRNGTYLSSENGGNVTCNRTEIGAWETFTMVTWADGTISFKGNNGLFLSDGHGDVNIQFEKEEAGIYEKFTYENLQIISVWDGESKLNGTNYNVVFEKNGGVYQDFSIIELPTIKLVSEKSVALYNKRSATYISSENGGNVTCNRKKIGSWETMTMVTWSDGTISFKGNNGLYLSDENGANNVQFSRKEAGLWEKFTLKGTAITRGDLTLNGSAYNVNFNGGAYWDFEIIDLSKDSNIVSEELIAISALRSAKYVSSENGGNVTCNRDKIGSWEKFTMVTWKDGTVSFKGNNGLYLSDGHGDSTMKFEKEEAGEYEKFIVDSFSYAIYSYWGDVKARFGADFSSKRYVTFANYRTTALSYEFEIIYL